MYNSHTFIRACTHAYVPPIPLTTLQQPHEYMLSRCILRSTYIQHTVSLLLCLFVCLFVFFCGFFSTWRTLALFFFVPCVVCDRKRGIKHTLYSYGLLFYSGVEKKPPAQEYGSERRGSPRIVCTYFLGVVSTAVVCISLYLFIDLYRKTVNWFYVCGEM